MMEKAQIIFCPYNYIIDPAIRDAMSIQLSHTAIMIDEAHNVLDVARDAASCTINLNEFLTQATVFLDYVRYLTNERKRFNRDDKAFLADSPELGVDSFSFSNAQIPMTAFTNIQARIERMRTWFLTTVSSLLGHRDDSFFRIEKKTRMIELLEQGAFDSVEDFRKMLTHLEGISTWEGGMMKEDAANHLPRRLSHIYRKFLSANKILGILGEFGRSCGFLYGENLQNASDFALVFETKKPQTRKRSGLQDLQLEKEKNTFLRLMCLNAARVFNEIKKKCSSIILTSGGRAREM